MNDITSAIALPRYSPGEEIANAVTHGRSASCSPSPGWRCCRPLPLCAVMLAPGRRLNRGRRHPASTADWMSAGQGLQLALPV